MNKQTKEERKELIETIIVIAFYISPIVFGICWALSVQNRIG